MRVWFRWAVYWLLIDGFGVVKWMGLRRSIGHQPADIAQLKIVSSVH